ncbi:MAG TPA: response regulator [Chloroflexia bacterium]|nr:response regulator [Chloroflexia bacterium]
MRSRAEKNNAPPHRTLHLVVVDDEPAIRSVCADILSDAGYMVSTAENGREVLALVAREPVDLVLMDVMMPVLDGLTTCKLLKQDARTRHIPVVIMSAATNIQSRLCAEHCIASAVVPKPFDFDELLDTVKSLVA